MDFLRCPYWNLKKLRTLTIIPSWTRSCSILYNTGSSAKFGGPTFWDSVRITSTILDYQCNYESFSATFLPVECVLLRPAAGLIARATVALACLAIKSILRSARSIYYSNGELLLQWNEPTVIWSSVVLCSVFHRLWWHFQKSPGGDHGHWVCLRLFLWPTLSDAKALVLGYFVASLMGCRFSSSSFS